MNFREQALKEHTKVNALHIVDYLTSNPKEMQRFVDVFVSGEYRVTQRLAWALGLLTKDNHDIIIPFLPQLITYIRDKTKHASVRRNILRAMQQIVIPVDLHGIVYSQCFDALMDPQEPIAVRCFSMKILGDIAMIHNDLASEVIEAIKLNEDGASAGYKSRAKRILKKLSNI